MYCRATGGHDQAGDFTHPYLQTVDCPGDVEAEGYMQMLPFPGSRLCRISTAYRPGNPAPGPLRASQVPDTIQIVSRDDAGYVDTVQIGKAGYTGEGRYSMPWAWLLLLCVEPYEDGIRAVVKGNRARLRAESGHR